MKRKIYFNIATLSALVAILVTGFLLLTFYNFHVKNEIRALKDYGKIMSDILDPLDDITADSLRGNTDPNIRLTIIDLDGNVLFDNMANPQTMENHLDREEVKDALKFGEGEAVRNSATLDKNTYYYAVLLSNNSILRISRQGATIFSHFKNVLPFIFLIVFLILLLSLFTSSILTKKILEPVENVVKNMEEIIDNRALNEFIVYDEIMPFIKKVENQKNQIKYNIKTLEEKAALMDVITSSMKEGFILIDENKKILSTNDSGIKLLQGDDNLSYYGDDFIKLSRSIKLHEALDKSIDTNSSEELILNLGEKYLTIYINPVLSNNILIGLVILVVDFTQKYKLDLMRREFSANVSHELKTPLTSINGYAEIIESGMAKNEDIKKFASTIRKEGVRLLNLIDSIIKLSRIEEEEYEKDFYIIDIYDIGENTMDNLKLIAGKKNISLNLYGKSTFINGNKDMIAELIYNLLDNGIKYTPYGGNVNLEIKSEDGWAIIKVSDTGIGIPASQQSRIFERFYTVDKSRSRKKQSIGIGLSIVKHIVEYHHGKIKLVSEINKGTEIIIKIKHYA
ncbi:MAG: ATP-binding protein [Tissierellaceae bacterium]|nr:ATP-binding protein [Tissierellaceae bacterium]